MRKYTWAAAFSAALLCFTLATLLDAFVWEREFATPAPSLPFSSPTLSSAPPPASPSSAPPSAVPPQSPEVSDEPDPPKSPEPILTDMSYIDGDIAIVIERVEQYGAVYYVADVVLSDPSLLMTAFAKGKYGRNITQRTSVMAGENNAIFAVNGDYYGFRNSGLIIRNGVFYRDVPRRSPDNTSAVIDANGDMFVVTEGQVSGQGLSANGAWQSFSFGPALIDGGVKTAYAAAGTRSKHPRTAFGQAGPLHYVFVVVDGRTSESSGMSFSVLADVLAERGCHVAYNLDGGGSSCMWFNGKVVNTPSDGTKIGERAISDIIYIPASLAGDAQ